MVARRADQRRRGARRTCRQPKFGRYTRAEAAGVTATALLFETFGGFSPAVVQLLKTLANDRQNRLTAREYEQTTWSARTWHAFNAQKLSVAVHYSAALEIAHALRMPTTGDGRSNPGAVACAVM